MRVIPARHYSVTVTTRQTGAVHRFTLPLWPTLALVSAALILPVLMGLGARLSAHAAIAELQQANARLQVENSSYREATGQLATQISELQLAVGQLEDHAAVDPTARHAMEKLPAIVKSQAMGGVAGSVTASMLGGAPGSPERALGVLSDLLGVIWNRLDSVRDTVERRHALAAATPSIWPVAGWLSSPFGRRTDPFTGDPDFHPGLDISADYGEPVLATGDAVVQTAGAVTGYGNLVVLDHHFGIMTRYGHLSRMAVSPGQEVKRGDVIGYVGATGRATAAHLHYEIWMNGRLTNPLRLLAK